MASPEQPFQVSAPCAISSCVERGIWRDTAGSRIWDCWGDMVGLPSVSRTQRARRLLGLVVLASLWSASAVSHRGQPEAMTPVPGRAEPGTVMALPAVAAGVRPAGGQPAPAAKAKPKPPRSFTLLASGDVLPHRSVMRQANAYGARSGRPYDFRPMFAAIRGIVSAADLAVCHLETPLSPTGRHLSGYPRFNAPPQLAAAIRDTGYDACSVASNHSMDQRPAGVAGTLRVLDRAGLRHAGMARTPQEARPALLTVRGVRVALLSYTYGLNGFRLPRERPWLVNLLAPGRVLAAARAARRAGSQFTVVFLHWGQEYRSAPTPVQQRVAGRLLADTSVDLVLGHHAHVVQPLRRIHGKWVAFGMGNSLSAQSAACCPAATQDGVLVQVKVAGKAGRFVVDQIGYTPTWVEHPGYRILPLSRSSATRGPLRASLRRTTANIGRAARPTTGR